MGTTKRKIILDLHDESLVNAAIAAIKIAVESAHRPAAVARRISVLATGYRNRGRDAARRRYPFKDMCEASGQPLAFEDADLDERETELGYAGELRWVCKKANNSGKRSCDLLDL
jgi:hypothetical protein